MSLPRIDALIMAQEGMPSLSRRAIEEMQLHKLNALLRREKERGGFYRDLPERLDSLAQLRELPFTTEEDLAQHAAGLLLCSQSEIRRVLSDATSGTTGAAKRVFYTEGDCENTVRLFMAGLGELIFPGGVTMICFPFSGPYGLGELIAEAVERLGARPLKLGAALSYGELRAVMEAERPDSFVGMPAQLLSLLRVCGRGSLRRALVSGDACPPAVLRACEERLGSRLFPHYGSREMALGGAICCPAHEGMRHAGHAAHPLPQRRRSVRPARALPLRQRGAAAGCDRPEGRAGGDRRSGRNAVRPARPGGLRRAPHRRAAAPGDPELRGA